MAFLDQDGLSVVLSSLKTKLTELYNTLYASINHNHSYTDLTDKPTIDTALSNTSTNAVQNKAIYTELGKKVNTSDIKDNLTSTDTNKPLSAAQGKALKDAIDGITTDIGNLGGGDMMKATYDSNNNGIVDNAEKLGGVEAKYYRNRVFVVSTDSPAAHADKSLTYSEDTPYTAYHKDGDILILQFTEGNSVSNPTIGGNPIVNNENDSYADTLIVGSGGYAILIWNNSYGSWVASGREPATSSAYGLVRIVNEVIASSTSAITSGAVYTAILNTENKIPTALSSLTGDSTHRTITDEERTAWNAKSNFSGSYNDLTNKPTIPTNNNQLTNGAGYQTASQVDSAIKAATSKVIEYGGSTDIAGLPDLAVAANAYKMYNITEGFTTTAQFLEGAGKSYPAGTNVVVIPNSAGTAYVFDIYTGSFAMSALTASEINAAFTAAGY